jgi:hypothetical protein
MIKEAILPTMRIGRKHLIRKTDIESQFRVVRCEDLTSHNLNYLVVPQKG